jgi:hypothetical protein
MNGLFHLGLGPVVCRVRCSPSHRRSHRRRLSASDRAMPALARQAADPFQQPADSLLSPRPGPRCVSSQPEQPHLRSKPRPHPHTAVLCCFLSFANVYLHQPLVSLKERPPVTLCAVYDAHSISQFGVVEHSLSRPQPVLNTVFDQGKGYRTSSNPTSTILICFGDIDQSLLFALSCHHTVTPFALLSTFFDILPSP